MTLCTDAFTLTVSTLRSAKRRFNGGRAKYGENRKLHKEDTNMSLN